MTFPLLTIFVGLLLMVHSLTSKYMINEAALDTEEAKARFRATPMKRVIGAVVGAVIAGLGVLWMVS